MMPSTGPSIDLGWIKTQAAKEFVSSLFYHGKRRQFGLLEQPSLPPEQTVNFVKYKIFLCGKSGVGKTATVAKLVGADISKTACETAGIETSTVHWPVRLAATGQILFFSLSFWDVGERACKKFDHVLSACVENVDAILYTFSLTDRSSFADIPQYVNKMNIQDDTKSPLRVIVATKADQYIHSDITNKELNDLVERTYSTLIRVQNVTKLKSADRSSIDDVVPFLNNLCELLWSRDQRMANIDTTIEHYENV